MDTTVWLTVKEAAEYARVGPRTIYREINHGRLRAARVGGRRECRLLASWVSDWLESNATGGPKPFSARVA